MIPWSHKWASSPTYGSGETYPVYLEYFLFVSEERNEEMTVSLGVSPTTVPPPPLRSRQQLVASRAARKAIATALAPGSGTVLRSSALM